MILVKINIMNTFSTATTTTTNSNNNDNNDDKDEPVLKEKQGTYFIMSSAEILTQHESRY